MPTQKEKSDASSRLAQKLKESKARAAKLEEQKEASRAKMIAKAKGNGQSAAATPVKPEPVKKTAPKKAAKPAKKNAAPAKKKAVAAAKKKGATQKRTVQVKKGKDPRVKKGLAALVDSKEIDHGTGLTVFQSSLVKLVEDSPEGILISDLILKVWPRKKIEEMRAEARESKGSSPDRLVRNAIRRPVEHGFIERADGKGLYRFCEWKKISPNKRNR